MCLVLNNKENILLLPPLQQLQFTFLIPVCLQSCSYCQNIEHCEHNLYDIEAPAQMTSGKRSSSNIKSVRAAASVKLGNLSALERKTFEYRRNITLFPKQSWLRVCVILLQLCYICIQIYSIHFAFLQIPSVLDLQI